MQCIECQEGIGLMMDLRLSHEAQPGLYSHLAECGECREFLSSMRMVRQAALEESSRVPEQIDASILALPYRDQARHRVGFKQWGSSPMTIHRGFVLAAGIALLVLASATTALWLRVMSLDTAAIPGGRTVMVVYQIPEEQVIGVKPVPIRMDRDHRRIVD